MNNQAFDELIRKKLNVPTPPPNDLWDRIEEKLDEQPATVAPNGTTMPFLYKGIAAAIVAAIAISALVFINNNENIPSDNMIVKDNQPTIPDATMLTNNSAAIKETSENVIKETIVSNEHTVTKTMPTSTNILTNHIPALDVHIVQPDNKVEIPKITIPETPVINEQIIAKQDPAIHTIEDYKPFPNEQRLQSPSQSADLSMGISGGYNMGSISNGAAFAFNTRKQINDKIYVDGTVGLVMNNADANLASYQGNYFADQKMMRTMNAKARPAVNQFANANALYYIQVNPTVGMNLTNRIDVSAGPDYQQMISNTDGDVIHFNAQRLTKKLPKHDFGLTGRAEFKINNNLKAGVTYREGMSSLINNNNDLQNRRYMQVHLKIQLPVRQ